LCELVIVDDESVVQCVLVENRVPVESKSDNCKDEDVDARVEGRKKG
jgi:hypothetical protein